MVSITSAPVWSAVTPNTGVVIAAFTGSSGERRAGDHPRAQVAVGDDPEVAGSEVHQDRAHGAGIHQLRGLAQGGRRDRPRRAACAPARPRPAARPPDWRVRSRRRPRSDRVQGASGPGSAGWRAGPTAGPRPPRAASRPACPLAPAPRTGWEGRRGPTGGRTSHPPRAGRRACRGRAAPRRLA